jgi:hypothetical protein
MSGHYLAGSDALCASVGVISNTHMLRVDCIPLAMAAASLWMAYNGLYMQMCSYRDGQVSDDAATPYATVLRFIRVGTENATPQSTCQPPVGYRYACAQLF